MHPVLFEIGGFPVGTYALLALAGLIAGVAVFSWLGAREGHDRWAFVEMGLWAFIIAIAASKLFGVAVGFDPDSPADSVRRMLRFAGHFWVGFLAGSTYLLIAFRRTRIGVGTGLDALVPGLALAHAIGRVGCFLAGCCWGAACDADWPLAVTFQSQQAGELTGVPLGVPLHPTQLYEAAAELAIFGVLLLTHLRWRRFAGQTFLHYVLLYGVARFAIEALRDDPRGDHLLGLSTTQALLVPAVAAAIVAYALLWRRRKARPRPAARPASPRPTPASPAPPGDPPASTPPASTPPASTPPASTRTAAAGTRRKRRRKKKR